jgi:thiol:disulfide interchange protein
LVPVAVATVVGGYFIVPEPTPVGPGGAVVDASGPIEWKAWSPEAVDKQLAAGVPVFVDFTADWCITCKANEKTIITRPEVVKRLKERGIVAMKADWTRPDERIRKALEQNGKAGVPMYLVYNPKRPNKPEVLPEVLTPGLLTDAFDAAVR